MPEQSEFPVTRGVIPAEQAYPVLMPGGLRVAGRLGVTACLAQSKVWTFDQTQVPAQGVAGVDARRATPPDPRLARWGLASCCQLDPSHAALLTLEDPGVEPSLIPCGSSLSLSWLPVWPVLTGQAHPHWFNMLGVNRFQRS